MYLAWLVPFQLFWVGMTWDMFITWLIWGTVLEMMFTYPIAKMTAKYAPRITKFLERKSNIRQVAHKKCD